MKVMKFGGTSVGSPSRIKNVVKLITDGNQNMVVLSAMSGTTNSLVEISDYLKKNNLEGANNVINQLEQKYKAHIEELYIEEEYKKKTTALLKEVLCLLRSFTIKKFSETDEKMILSQGELLSTNMVTNYMLENNYNVKLLSALDFMKTDENEEPNLLYIRQHLKSILEEDDDKTIYITQGFICRDYNGNISNLLRGGSDYTASLIGAALEASEIQIWTDIDGMHNNDPRFVENTKPVRQLNFDEAAELAYFGAKILHPTCIQPARYAGVPVKLLNTLDPKAPGTIINNEMQKGKIKAIAAKDNITAIKILSSRMLLATGFLRKIFEIFEKYNTSIDMIATSEVAVSLSIDNTNNLTNIVNELKNYGAVDIDRNMCIICVVGDLRWSNIGFESTIMKATLDVPIRIISYGGSNHNISFLVKEEDKKQILQTLSNTLFK